MKEELPTSEFSFLDKIRNSFPFNKFCSSKKNQDIGDTITELVSESDDSDFGAEEKEILINAVNFTDTLIEDVMVPRSDIIAAEMDSDFEQLKKFFLEKGHSRLPIYQDSLDNIKGFIHVKDIFPYFAEPEGFNLREKMKRTLFVPPAMKIVDLAYKMRNEATRIAVVVDEYGGTDGLITVEDLMDEIFGEVADNDLVVAGENLYEVGARIKIEDLEEKLKLNLLEHSNIDDDFDTLAGLIFAIHKKIPKAGEVINYGKLKFHIKEAAPRFIKKVVIELPQNEKN